MHHGEGGHSARAFRAEEFAAAGLPVSYPPCITSFNKHRGTSRGLHYQAEPFPEAKLVHRAGGAIFDVAIDLPPDSPTRCQWFGLKVTAAKTPMLSIPDDFAQGVQTVEDASEVFCQIGESYRDDLARGGRWNDKAFGIQSPIGVRILSSRDAEYPYFAPPDFAPPDIAP